MICWPVVWVMTWSHGGGKDWMVTWSVCSLPTKLNEAFHNTILWLYVCVCIWYCKLSSHMHTFNCPTSFLPPTHPTCTVCTHITHTWFTIILNPRGVSVMYGGVSWRWHLVYSYVWLLHCSCRSYTSSLYIQTQTDLVSINLALHIQHTTIYF